jgi:hypothetical protein
VQAIVKRRRAVTDNDEGQKDLELNEEDAENVTGGMAQLAQDKLSGKSKKASTHTFYPGGAPSATDSPGHEGPELTSEHGRGEN